MSTPRGGRVALIIVGALIAMFSLAVLVAAGALHWVNGRAGDDGYFTTPSARFEAPTYAIVDDDVDIDNGLAALGSLGDIRLHVRSEQPVFVGIGRAADVAGYLGGYAAVEELDVSPFRATYRIVEGDAPAGPPGGQDFWLESVEGSGDQTLSWDPEEGTWSVVLMNADASRGVAAEVKAAAKIPLVGTLAWIATAVGLGILALGVLLIVLGARRRQPPAPAGSAWGA